MAEINKPADLTKYIWGQTGQSVRPSNAKINLGWVAEIPPYQFENWVQNRSDTAIAHIAQHGISAWDSSTEYLANRSVVLGSNNQLYKAIQTGTNIDPVTDGGANWITLFEDIKEAATTTKKGVVELATDAEARGRSSSNVVVTPSGLGSALDSHESGSSVHGISAVTGLQAALNSLSNDITSQINAIDISSYFTSQKSPSGYVILPGGIIFQWGQTTVARGLTAIVSYTLAFPNECFLVVGSKGSSISNNEVEPAVGLEKSSSNKTQFEVTNTGGGGAYLEQGIYWFAVGY